MITALLTAAALLVIGAGVIGVLVGRDLDKRMRALADIRARIRFGLAAIAFGYGGLGLLAVVAYFAAQGVLAVAL